MERKKLGHRNGDPPDKEAPGVYLEGMTKSATAAPLVIFQVSMRLGCLAADTILGLLSSSLYPYHKFLLSNVI